MSEENSLGGVISSGHKSNELSDVRCIMPGINWEENYDFDGDGINEVLYFPYSGGAHCCYQLVLISGDKKDSLIFPFEIDGGYIGGIDLSKPKNFDIKDFDQDGLPEIYMRIEYENGVYYPVPEVFQKTFGIRTNFILIDFYNGEYRVLDL